MTIVHIHRPLFVLVLGILISGFLAGPLVVGIDESPGVPGPVSPQDEPSPHFHFRRPQAEMVRLFGSLLRDDEYIFENPLNTHMDPRIEIIWELQDNLQLQRALEMTDEQVDRLRQLHRELRLQARIDEPISPNGSRSIESSIRVYDRYLDAMQREVFFPIQMQRMEEIVVYEMNLRLGLEAMLQRPWVRQQFEIADEQVDEVLTRAKEEKEKLAAQIKEEKEKFEERVKELVQQAETRVLESLRPDQKRRLQKALSR